MTKKNIIYSLAAVIIVGFSISAFAGSGLMPITDSVNSGIINTKIIADDKLENADIDATVVNGIVIYTGTVQTRAQLDELIRIGRSVSGIRGVDASKIHIMNK